MKTIIFTLTLTFSNILIAHADSQNFDIESLLTTTSGWVNQSGSVATFTTSPTTNPGVYTLSGNYINNAANTGCKGTPYPLLGYYYPGTGVMSWSVAWSNATQDCQSTTGWTGYIGNGAITTNWNLAFKGSGGQAIQQGQDTFTYQTVTLSEMLPH